jgi:hypothetical protein
MGLEDPGSKSFFSPKCSDWLWRQPLTEVYWGSIPEVCMWDMKLITQLHLLLKLRMSGDIPLLPLVWTRKLYIFNIRVDH